jgi:TPR repeat protein/TolA-binding protein
MPFTRSVKIFLLICLPLAVAFSFGACVPARFAKEDVEHLQMSAQRGDAQSRVLIGEVYEFGADVSANPLIAAQWYQLAAKQGHPEAQFYLGVMYERGDVLRRRPAESVRWLFKSGEQGFEKARIELAALYLKDKELRREFSKRIRVYRQGAEKGDAAAQYALAWIYSEGAGLPVNFGEALKWYQKAALQGNSKAQFALGNIYLEGKAVPANSSQALAWYRKSAEKEIKALVKLYELYKGAGGIPENAEEAQKWSKMLPRNTDVSLRSYIDLQHTIVNLEKERNPVRAKRACERISEVDPAPGDVSNTCISLQKRISEKMNPRIEEAESALVQKDWGRFRDLLSLLMTPDFDGDPLRRLIAPAWRFVEEEARAKEKIAEEQLQPIEAALKSAAFRKKNRQQIASLIHAFEETVARGLDDHPEDAAFISLARRGKKIIAGLQQKMKPQRRLEEKPVIDLPDESQDDVEPGEDDYNKAQALFNSGRFEEAAKIFEKTTKIRGSRFIASAYVYLGISHLARINPADINEARKLQLKGLSSFQNALRFDDDIALPDGYDKYQPVFDEARERLH